MKKKFGLIFTILFLFVVLFPVKHNLKDGGSVCYQSLIYSVTQLHCMNDTYVSGYEEGIEISILGQSVYQKISSKKIADKDNSNKE